MIPEVSTILQLYLPSHFFFLLSHFYSVFLVSGGALVILVKHIFVLESLLRQHNVFLTEMWKTAGSGPARGNNGVVHQPQQYHQVPSPAGWV